MLVSRSKNFRAPGVMPKVIQANVWFWVDQKNCLKFWCAVLEINFSRMRSVWMWLTDHASRGINNPARLVSQRDTAHLTNWPASKVLLKDVSLFALWHSNQIEWPKSSWSLWIFCEYFPKRYAPPYFLNLWSRTSSAILLANQAFSAVSRLIHGWQRVPRRSCYTILEGTVQYPSSFLKFRSDTKIVIVSGISFLVVSWAYTVVDCRYIFTPRRCLLYLRNSITTVKAMFTVSLTVIYPFQMSGRICTPTASSPSVDCLSESVIQT